MRGDSYGIYVGFIDAVHSDAVFVHQVGLQVCVGDVGKAEGSYGAVGGAGGEDVGVELLQAIAELVGEGEVVAVY